MKASPQTPSFIYKENKKRWLGASAFSSSVAVFTGRQIQQTFGFEVRSLLKRDTSIRHIQIKGLKIDMEYGQKLLSVQDLATKIQCGHNQGNSISFLLRLISS